MNFSQMVESSHFPAQLCAIYFALNVALRQSKMTSKSGALLFPPEFLAELPIQRVLSVLESDSVCSR